MNKISKYATNRLQDCLKTSILSFSRLIIPALFVIACSLEKPVDQPPKPDPLDPEVINLSTTINKLVTRGTPIDTVSEMVTYNVNFGFFCSYTNTNMWSAATDAPGKMFNEKMLPYYDLTHPYPDIVLWKYAGTPVYWLQNRSDDHYTFFGYAPFASGLYDPTTNPTGNGVTVTSTATTPGIPALSYTVPVKVENQPDLMLAVPVKDLVPTGHPVQMDMKHALTAVGFRVKGANQEKVTNICLTDIYTKGNIAMDGGAIAWSIDPASKKDVDFSASINFDSGQTYRTVPTDFTDDFFIDHSWLMMIPQTLGSTSVVRVTLTDGTTREVNLNIYNTWNAGEKLLYDVIITPSGAMTVIPGNTLLPYYAQTPATQHVSVICLLSNGNPDPYATWELSTTAPWLQLALLPDGSDAGSSVAGTGTQNVYLVVTQYLGLNPPRVANLSLDGGSTTAAIVSQSALPGDNFSGWIYVRKGAIGNGMDWGNAVPTITEGIAMAEFLVNNGYGSSLKGVLVAGGSGKVYNELPNIYTAGIKVFGGWEGLPGTELSASDDPYTSPHHNLTQYKAVVSIGGNYPAVSAAGALLDGFIIQGATGAMGLQLINGGSANAIEIKGQTFSDPINYPALYVDNSTATNILVADNNTGVRVQNGGKLINATIVNITGPSNLSNGTMYNSVVWNSSMVFAGTTIVEYCAFPASNTAGLALHPNNIALNANNTAWFSAVNVVPGPHFNMNSDIARPYYSALSDRAPMLGRGDQDLFDNNTPYMATPPAKTDINGKARHYLATDMGCYEDGVYKGFTLTWNMYDFYVSSRADFVSDHPLLLTDNMEMIEVAWHITADPLSGDHTFTLVNSSGVTQPYLDGVGSGVMVGLIYLKTGPVAHTQNSSPLCGTITISSQLGGYLPDRTLNVYRIPGTSSVWDNGYVGSFHKNNETEERCVFGTNSGEWTIRIVKGLDWIKIDDNPRNSFGGIVQETFGGFFTRTGNIYFRVGTKSTLPPGAPPRYGLILIQRTGGVALFFVRQGEEADYLYAPSDVRVLNGPRSAAMPISPYNVVAQEYYTYNGAQATNHEIDPSATGNQGKFIDYPSKVGSYFQWNRTYSFIELDQLPTLEAHYAAYSSAREVCPPGFRHATQLEFVQSVYRDRPIGITSPTDSQFLDNFVWGRLADGYFDKLAGNVNAVYWVGSGYNRATYGLLMVNHNTMASVFWPMSGSHNTSTLNGPTHAQAPNLYLYQPTYCYYPTSSLYSSSQAWATHWSGGHIGMRCTSYGNGGIPVRCFLIDPAAGSGSSVDDLPIIWK